MTPRGESGSVETDRGALYGLARDAIRHSGYFVLLLIIIIGGGRMVSEFMNVQGDRYVNAVVAQSEAVKGIADSMSDKAAAEKLAKELSALSQAVDRIAASLQKERRNE